LRFCGSCVLTTPDAQQRLTNETSRQPNGRLNSIKFINTPDQDDSHELLPERIQYNNYLKSYLDLRDDIDNDSSKNHQLRLFNGLNIDYSAEILAQAGIFSVPVPGS
jgi:hypothetical protein